MCGLAACVAAPARIGSSTEPTDARAIVEAYYAAINRRDLLVLPAYVTADVAWYSVVDGERLLEVDSREALTEAFETYFARFASTSVNVDSWLSVGDKIAVHEHTYWSDGTTSGGGERLGVFELAGGRIVRVTYFLPDVTTP